MEQHLKASLSRRTFLAGSAVAAATAGLALSGCGSNGDSGSTGSTDSGAAAEGGALTVASMNTTDSYLPFNCSKALALGANWHVMEGLYELDMATYEPYAALAAGDPVEISETEYEVTLRDGAKFSDGTAVTAADVAKSYERTVGAEGALYLSMLNFIDSVEAKDDATVTIKLAYPFSLLKERLPLIKVAPSAATDDELTSQPVGTGPWMYASAPTEQTIEFAPNPNYNGSHPAKADTMHWDIIADDTARTTALQEGTVQVMESVPADVADQLNASGITVEDVQSFGLAFMMFNTKKKPFDDYRVRQAFLYAIDMEKLIGNALSGKATPLKSFLPENHANFHEASTVYTYDPEKAKSLLAEAGVSDLSIVLNTTDTGFIVALAPQIQNDLKEIGVTVTEIKSEPSKTMYPNYTDTDDPQFDVVLAPGDPSCFGLDPDLLMNWWYGDNTWTQKRTQWKGSAEFEQLQELLSQAAQAADAAEQQELWNQCFDLIAEQVPLYPLFHRTVSTGYWADQLDGFKAIGTTSVSMIDVAPKA